jgi:thiol-disulfide isomerase/thioredoxin
VLIDFWATFCKPCLWAMPELEKLQQKYRASGLLVLGISLDAAGQRDEVRAEVARLGVTFPILLDQETRVVALYNPRSSAPYSVLIGRDGRVIRKQEGYSSGEMSAVEADIQAALAR